MYRLVLYFLFSLVIIASMFSYLSILHYDPSMLLLSTAIILLVCFVVNWVFSKAFNAPTNNESLYITALILALIVSPPESFNDLSYFFFILWVAIWAMASKYIIAIGKKHIFNPVAVAVVITAFSINQSASWWISTTAMTPFILIGGLLIVRKIRRFDMVLSFICVSILGTVVSRFSEISQVPQLIWDSLVSSPTLFFAFVMLTEPLTTPPTKNLRMYYGAIVGALFDPMIRIGSVYSTPELALVVGNLFSYIVSPKEKYMLKLKEKKEIADNVYDFSFEADKTDFAFKPGQYLEWTLEHEKSDNRGNRRYFTIASSPIEEYLRMGVKFYPNSSSFKKTLLSMKPGDVVVASQRAGDFTMPENKDAKLCFIAGGIGVTPFESMTNYMLTKKQKRDIVMFYSCRTDKDIAYRETFEQARKELGMNTVYVLSEENSIPANWDGEKGFVTAEMIKKHLPDFKERTFYISGPHIMVTIFEETLSKMGVPGSHIKTDFFPGFV